MDKELRKIVIIDPHPAHHELYHARLGTGFRYDDYTESAAAVEHLSAKNDDAAMVIVGDDIADPDPIQLIMMLRKNCSCHADAVLMMKEVSAANMNRGYQQGYDLVLSEDMNEETFTNIIANRLMRAQQIEEAEQNFAGYSQVHERGNALVINILTHAVYEKTRTPEKASLQFRAFFYQILQKVQKYGKYYRLKEADMDACVQASCVYDIGMTEIPEAILAKNGPLTEDEKKTVSRHTFRGAEIVRRACGNVELPVVHYAYNMCLCHHERYDGSGYPRGLKEHDIPLCAAVCGIVDSYLALRTERPWRHAYDMKAALQMIRNGECGMFDPILLQVLEETAKQLEGREFHVRYENNEVIAQVRDQFYRELFPGLNPENQEPVTHTQLIAELTHYIIFTYTMHPSVLYLSEHASDKFGLPDQVENPLMNARIRRIIDKEQMEELWQKLVNLEDRNSRIRQDVQINYRGHKEWDRIIAVPTYAGDELTGCIGVISNVDSEHVMMDSLAFQAVHDPLTGLYNRNYFRHKAGEILKENKDAEFAFCELDVDHFKKINDTYGHTAGDAVLIRLGNIMEKNLRREDMAVRLGGDEFLLFYQIGKVADVPVKRLFEEIRQSQDDKVPHFTISCGITTTRLSGRDYEKLYRDADQALYEAKKQRSSYAVYKGENE